MVTVGSFCSSDPAPPGFSQVVSFGRQLQGNGGQQHITNPTITIDPAAMPAGTKLSFGNFQLSTSQQTSMALIDTNSYTCTSTAPTTPLPGGDILHYGRAAS
jgi:hypothetical protein